MTQSLPNLRGEHRIIINAETTGLRWWEDDRPIGWAWRLPESNRMGYVPIRHSVGDNVPVEQVHEWLRREVRDIHVENANTKFDLHMARVDGVDLTEQNCTFGDVAHQAALLDDNRYRFNLDQLAVDFLGWRDDLGKVPEEIETEGGFQDLHPDLVTPYALRNVEQVHRLHNYFEPLIREEELGDVLALEQEIIPVVVEMEKNGTMLDMDLLTDWCQQATHELEEQKWFIFRETGVKVSSFDSRKDMQKLFEKCGVPITEFTPTGKPSFTDEVMQSSDHPAIKAARHGGHLADLKSKYLDKYLKAVRADGWLRFNLHQLRTTKDSNDKFGAGTVSGRFSAAGDKFGGYNPQQVVAVEKQLERGWCSDYVIRRLFKLNFAADMAQVEYRLFAHYAETPDILEVYRQDPRADYHAVVMKLLHQVNPDLNRKLTKNINFAKIYGAGLAKFALMLGQITQRDFEELAGQRRAAWGDPRLQQARLINNQYDQMFPAVAPLLRLASRTAERRGYVRTILGRRARLLGRFHSALNRIIQGGAADIHKRVLVEVYKLRKQLGLMMLITVHDELVCNIADPTATAAVEAVLNEQHFDLKVPILWDVKTGTNWAECK